MKLLFGMKEDGVYGDTYPIFIHNKKKGDIQIGYISKMDRMPEVPDEKKKEDIMRGARKTNIVIGMHQRYFKKLTDFDFKQIKNKVLTGDKNNDSY